MNKLLYVFFVGLVGLFSGCQSETLLKSTSNEQTPYLIVLGVAQDAGYPQAGCYKSCCKALWVTLLRKKWSVASA